MNMVYASAMTHIAGKKYRLDQRTRRCDQFSKKIMPCKQKSLGSKKYYIEPSLCSLLKHNRHLIMPILWQTCSSLQEAGMAFSALAQTNKFLNECINDKENTLLLIKELSQHFTCSNEKVAKTLCTDAAHYRYLMQKTISFSAVVGCKTTDEELNKLRKKGLDLDFTHGSGFGLPLIEAVHTNNYRTISLVKWFINSGVDINKPDCSGKNAVIYAIENYKKDLIPLLLDHPQLNVHFTDNENNTLLHACVKCILLRAVFDEQYQMNIKECDFVIEIMNRLLAKGLNPKTKNNHGKTAWEYALHESGKELPHLHYPSISSGRYKNIIPQTVIDFLRDIENDF